MPIMVEYSVGSSTSTPRMIKRLEVLCRFLMLGEKKVFKGVNAKFTKWIWKKIEQFSDFLYFSENLLEML